ncbi:MAG: NAD(P)-dependent oxidoreductase [Pseudomonadota bacterium]
MIRVLIATTQAERERFGPPLEAALAQAGLKAALGTEFAPEEVDYIVYTPTSGLADFSAFIQTKAVLSLWAGVERIVGNETLTMPLTRMVDPGLTAGMVEWVAGHVLRYHLDTDIDVCRSDARWEKHLAPLAPERSVVVFGLGALGAAAAQTLAGLGFDVSGWSRSAKDIPGIKCLHGDAGLAQALSRAEIAVLLLPDTPDTTNLFNAQTLAQMPRGTRIINPGRGPLIDDDALLLALAEGHIAHATLDVFRVEPLPEAHPYWAHPNVTVTPHIAAETRASSATWVIAENIRRGEAGEPFLHLVDRTLGY